MFKGTTRRTQLQIAQEMDAIGGQTDAFTSKEYASFNAKVLDEHVPQVVDLLADIVLNPSFDPEELERERKVIFEEIKMVEDTPDDLVHEIFIESFWPDHSLGLPILGTEEIVSAFDRDQLLRFFRETYTPANLIVSAAGNLDHQRVLDLVESHFRPFKRARTKCMSRRPRLTQPYASGKRTSSRSIWSWAPSPPIKAMSTGTAATVLNTILGGTMSSRLFQVIREKRGQAWPIASIPASAAIEMRATSQSMRAQSSEQWPGGGAGAR